MFFNGFLILVGRIFGKYEETLAAGNVCTLLEYASDFIIATVLLLSACTFIAFSVTSYF